MGADRGQAAPDGGGSARVPKSINLPEEVETIMRRRARSAGSRVVALSACLLGGALPPAPGHCAGGPGGGDGGAVAPGGAAGGRSGGRSFIGLGTLPGGST